MDIRVFYCFEYHTIIQQIHQSFVPGRYAGDTAFNRPVKTTGLAGGLHHPYKGLLPACARKA
ncbi:hypothetical protein, partial [[Clostridium] symbiosum]|uniref:hypothetical protein n=1 Tax=Clostridium symbiosum TaxID=1512 RepID=UPI001A9B6724